PAADPDATREQHPGAQRNANGNADRELDRDANKHPDAHVNWDHHGYTNGDLDGWSDGDRQRDRHRDPHAHHDGSGSSRDPYPDRELAEYDADRAQLRHRWDARGGRSAGGHYH